MKLWGEPLGFASLKFSKAIIIGLLAYVTALFVDWIGNSFVQSYFNFMSYVWWIVSTMTIFLLTRYYYFNQKPKNPVTDGFLLGILFVAITFFMEITFIVYGFGMGWGIYQFWIIWIQYPLVLISPIISGLTK
jgi:hypothetical protein